MRASFLSNFKRQWNGYLGFLSMVVASCKSTSVTWSVLDHVPFYISIYSYIAMIECFNKLAQTQIFFISNSI